MVTSTAPAAATPAAMARPAAGSSNSTVLNLPVGVTSRTLYRWQKEPEFDAAYRAAKRAAFDQTIARLHHLSSAAVSTLGKVMLDPGTPPATKVRAADSILNHTITAIEDQDIMARVAELERGAEESKPGHRP